MKSRAVIILFAFICSYIIINTSENWKNRVFQWDKSGYHVYLPAAFIYNSIDSLAFYPIINGTYRPSLNGDWYAIYSTEKGRKVNRYQIGLAILEAPFFLIAHAYNLTFKQYSFDGYSVPYQYGTLFSSVFWTVIGLVLLRRLLKRYYNENIVAATLLAVAFGTNLYHYNVFDGGMAHPYSFFQFSTVLYFTDSLYRTGKNKYLYLLAMMLGLVVITRVSNIVVTFVPLLWGVYNLATFKERLTFYSQKRLHIVLGVILFLGVIMLQIGYWKYTTGYWIYDTYPDEGFIWSQPRIWRGLFGFQKGWFIYTPLAFVAVVGLLALRKQYKQFVLPIVLFLIVNIYIVFSWWNWWYGGGFGARSLIETLAIMSFPLAAAFAYVSKKNKPVIVAAGVILLLLVSLNILQSYQRHKGVLHYERMSFKAYTKLFFETTYKPEFEEYYMPNSEFYKEMDGRWDTIQKKHGEK
ncbi:MAG: hypothetical protein H6551_12340 [Chitinophagales bacterium]|nr:hypothetical protein [Chitinophagaceae bacterium]MCB9065919.1 hypothetical protein [Chitinophagales bacterium]